MDSLKERILQDGQVLSGGVLKVDSFLNHQLDVALLDDVGAALAQRFQGGGVTRILTVEASGIAFACAVARVLRVPVVFAKKNKGRNITGDVYSAAVYSFTRQQETEISVSARFLLPEDTVLIIDDFLANGSALSALCDIVRQSGAALAGAGIVIEKAFQGGGDALRAQGMRIESLVRIQEMDERRIVFA